jgi:hypothetical protein
LLPGTLRSLCTRRIKNVRASVWDACRRAYIAETQRHLKALDHDLKATAAMAEPFGSVGPP